MRRVRHRPLTPWTRPVHASPTRRALHPGHLRAASAPCAVGRAPADPCAVPRAALVCEAVGPAIARPGARTACGTSAAPRILAASPVARGDERAALCAVWGGDQRRGEHGAARTWSSASGLWSVSTCLAPRWRRRAPGLPRGLHASRAGTGLGGAPGVSQVTAARPSRAG
jgi:hypothetical protein